MLGGVIACGVICATTPTEKAALRRPSQGVVEEGGV
jgi:hypothetical protein